MPANPKNGIVVMYFDEKQYSACRDLFAEVDPAPRFCLLEPSYSVDVGREKFGPGFLALPFAVKLPQRDLVICTHSITRYQLMRMIRQRQRPRKLLPQSFQRPEAAA